MLDTLSMAQCYGLVLHAERESQTDLLDLDARSLNFQNFQALIAGWVPLTVALNSLNRSMGIVDPYPFILTPEIVRKIHFVHDLIANWNADDVTRGITLARWRPDADGVLPPSSFDVLVPVTQRQSGPRLPARAAASS
jgi:hypothetical protein